VLADARGVRLLDGELVSPPLGFADGEPWEGNPVSFEGDWALLLYTDGLIEGRVGENGERLGQDGMVELVGRQHARGLRGEDLLRETVSEVRRLNGGELTDDVAVVLLDREP